MHKNLENLIRGEITSGKINKATNRKLKIIKNQLCVTNNFSIISAIWSCQILPNTEIPSAFWLFFYKTKSQRSKLSKNTKKCMHLHDQQVAQNLANGPTQSLFYDRNLMLHHQQTSRTSYLFLQIKIWLNSTQTHKH